MRSGGIAAYARDGALVSMDARLVLRDEGIHISPERVATDLKSQPAPGRGRRPDPGNDRRSRSKVCARDFPEADGKEVYTLKEFAGGRGDIEDPVGQDEGVYAACRDEIKGCLERLIDRLAPPPE